MNEDNMTCAEADGILLEYFERALDGPSRQRFEQHASSCARCSGLIRDVNDITAQAAALPVMAPSRDLWQGIEARIQPAVVSIGAARPAGGLSRVWMAAAASLLIVATASVTYFATSRSIAARVADSRPAVSRSAPEAGVGTAAAEPGVAYAELDENNLVDETGAAVPAAARSGAGARAGTTTLASGSAQPLVTAADMEYGDEIQRLQTVLAARRQQLDPSTVQVVEDNLKLIETAVAQARAALRADPASGFLAGKLSDVLEKKVELLRTVALLPSRS